MRDLIVLPPVSRFFRIEHDDTCALCPNAIDEGELVGALADVRGYVCSACHDDDER